MYNIIISGTTTLAKNTVFPALYVGVGYVSEIEKKLPNIPFEKLESYATHLRTEGTHEVFQNILGSIQSKFGNLTQGISSFNMTEGMVALQQKTFSFSISDSLSALRAEHFLVMGTAATIGAFATVTDAVFKRLPLFGQINPYLRSGMSIGIACVLTQALADSYGLPVDLQTFLDIAFNVALVGTAVKVTTKTSRFVLELIRNSSDMISTGVRRTCNGGIWVCNTLEWIHSPEKLDRFKPIKVLNPSRKPDSGSFLDNKRERSSKPLSDSDANTQSFSKRSETFDYQTVVADSTDENTQAYSQLDATQAYHPDSAKKTKAQGSKLNPINWFCPPKAEDDKSHQKKSNLKSDTKILKKQADDSQEYSLLDAMQTNQPAAEKTRAQDSATKTPKKSADEIAQNKSESKATRAYLPDASEKPKPQGSNWNPINWFYSPKKAKEENVQLQPSVSSPSKKGKYKAENHHQNVSSPDEQENQGFDYASPTRIIKKGAKESINSNELEDLSFSVRADTSSKPTLIPKKGVKESINSDELEDLSRSVRADTSNADKRQKTQDFNYKSPTGKTYADVVKTSGPNSTPEKKNKVEKSSIPLKTPNGKTGKVQLIDRDLEKIDDEEFSDTDTSLSGSVVIHEAESDDSVSEEKTSNHSDSDTDV